MDQIVEKRIDNRTSVSWKARCFTASETYWDVTIVDSSDGGFGLSDSLPLSVGAQLKIAIDGIGVFPCKLAWKDEVRCGIALLDEVHAMSTEEVAILDSVFAELDQSGSRRLG